MVRGKSLPWAGRGLGWHHFGNGQGGLLCSYMCKKQVTVWGTRDLPSLPEAVFHASLSPCDTKGTSHGADTHGCFLWLFPCSCSANVSFPCCPWNVAQGTKHGRDCSLHTDIFNVCLYVCALDFSLVCLKNILCWMFVQTLLRSWLFVWDGYLPIFSTDVMILVIVCWHDM